MFRLSVRDLVHHRLRLVATVVAIVLGVGFVSGTLVLTDTIRASLQTLLGQGGAGIGVVVTAHSAVAPSGSSPSSPVASAPMSAEVIGRVEAVPGVVAADGQVVGSVQLLRPDGRPVGSSFAPSLGISVGTVPSLRVLTLRSGRFPSGPTQMVVDVATARAQHYHLGSKVRVAGAIPAHAFTVVGTVGYGSSDNLAGATLAGFDLPTAQAVTGLVGKVQSVLVQVALGTSDQVLATRIARVLGPGYTVQTGAQYRRQSVASLGAGTGFLATALLIFAGVSLFVGAFIIFNTFSIIVAQRSRELALLRCLGAYRRQLLTMVLGESALVGTVSSVIGLFVGIGLAAGLRGLLALLGVSLPSTSPQILPRTVVVSLVVGTVVTMAAAVLPARRASRASPLAALGDGTASDAGSSVLLRSLVGVALALTGATLLVVGLFGHGNGRAIETGAGAAALLLAISAFGPALAPPLAGVIGRPFARLAKLPGHLARENAMRHPRRTSSTAAALMIGISLVTLVAVFAQTFKASLASSLANGLTADGIVTPVSVTNTGFTTSLAATLAADRHFASVTGLEQGYAAVRPVPPVPPALPSGRRSPVGAPVTTEQVLGVNVTAFLADIALTVHAGSIRALDSSVDTVALSRSYATAHHLRVGGAVEATFPTSGTRRLRVVGIFSDPTKVSGSLLVSRAAFAVHYPVERTDEAVILRWAPGVTPTRGLAALHQALAPYPQVKGQNRAQYLSTQETSINQLVELVGALLALAIIIALFGIVNTLALSVMERTREIGLLRVLGMSRRQLRSMVRWESVIIALLGSLLGVVVGLGFAWVLVRSLRSRGLTAFAVPWETLVVMVALSALAGVLAAVLPARRAARVDLLEALAVV